MDAKLKKRGGFTFIEVIVTMGMSAFFLGGFMMLWAGVAKQQDASWTEQTIDAYGNFVMYRLNQDLKNAYFYNLFRNGGLDAIDLWMVDYTNRSPDTIKVRWIFQNNGEAIRYRTFLNSTIPTYMRSEFGPGGNVITHWRKQSNLNESMFCTKFKLTPGGDPNRLQDYGKLDSTGVQVEYSLRYTRAYPELTSNSGDPKIIQPTYQRLFTWKTMIYMKNYYINMARRATGS